MHFGTKNYLKSNRYHITKHPLKRWSSTLIDLLPPFFFPLKNIKKTR
jgi:hypothetical protein